ncbi:hypothetical protein [Catellatospora sp. NPDC049133]
MAKLQWIWLGWKVAVDMRAALLEQVLAAFQPGRELDAVPFGKRGQTT